MTPDDYPIARDVLSQDEAVARARLVSGISYEIHLDLVAGASAYRGDVTIRFDYDPSAGDDAGTFLDHRGGGIERIEVNGEEIESPTGEYRIPLPASALQASNVVRVRYEHEYDHTGDGFHQFVDPEDGGEYLYSNFEPYNAHRLFPCFDQPDLKATYDLTVDAPSDWELIANGPELEREELEDGRLRRRYAPRGALQHVPVRPHRGAVPRRPRRASRRPARLLLPPLAGPPPRRRRAVRGDEAGPRLLRRVLRLRLPVRQVRPDLRAGVQLRRDGEHRRGHALRAHGLPRPADR